MLVPPALTACHLIIRVCFLSSVKDDEPELAKEEGGSADSRAAENGYETDNFLIPVIAGLARKQIATNYHCVHFKVITKYPTSQFQVP